MNGCVHVPLPAWGIVILIFALVMVFGVVVAKWKLKGFLIALAAWGSFAGWFIVTHSTGHAC